MHPAQYRLRCRPSMDQSVLFNAFGTNILIFIVGLLGLYSIGGSFGHSFGA